MLSKEPRSRQGRRWPEGCFGVLLVLPIVAGSLALAPRLVAQPPARMAASTESQQATTTALEVLERGGSAADAAVAAAFVAGVTNPTSSGIGGGGFALVWDAASQKARFIDFRESAPSALTPQDLQVRPVPEAQRGAVIGVPGEVAGLFAIHGRWGRMPWRDLVEPAERFASRGFVAGRHLAEMVGWAKGRIARDPLLRATYLPAGAAVRRGQRLRNAELAAALRRIAAHGREGFYSGPIAQDIVEAARANGGSLSRRDLAAYTALERDPIAIDWEGLTVHTASAPSAGGLMLAQTLGLHSKAQLHRLGQSSGAYQHLLAETFRGAIADRMRDWGDPAVVPSRLSVLVGRRHLAARAAKISIERTHPLERFVEDERGTHHLSIADRYGNVVALTTTVNRLFGSMITSRRFGIVLNDQLLDFTPTHEAAKFGAPPYPNSPRPGARPVSSMTPTVVTRAGQPIVALGGSGGMAIATNVCQVLLSTLVFEQSAEQALAMPRFYVPNSGATIAVARGASPALVRDLRWRGEIVDERASDSTAVQLLTRVAGGWTAAADPRKHGSAGVR